MSRLGKPAPQPLQPIGAARWAAPIANIETQPAPAEAKQHHTALAAEHKNIIAAAQAPLIEEKERTTLYLPLDVQERFADLRRQLRRRGLRARDASNSALVMRVFRGMSDEELLPLFGMKTKAR